MVNVYETVTNRIIAALEGGVIPWRKEWAVAAAKLPANYISKRTYRGINVWLLLDDRYTSNHWLTYKQAVAIGANVRKGEKGTPIMFWKFDKRTNEESGKAESWVLARQYTVFNVEQCDGIPAEIPAGVTVAEFEPLEAAEAIAEGYLRRGPSLAHGGNSAYYMSLTDHVQMPHREVFTSPDAYYSTLFHELAHSTGHQSRLARYEIGEKASFGSESYSKEELTAEITAAFLCAEAGISNVTVETNHAAYLQHWLTALKHDKTLVVSAAQRAQKAADYILDRKVQSESGDNQNEQLQEAA